MSIIIIVVRTEWYSLAKYHCCVTRFDNFYFYTHLWKCNDTVKICKEKAFFVVSKADCILNHIMEKKYFLTTTKYVGRGMCRKFSFESLLLPDENKAEF